MIYLFVKKMYKSNTFGTQDIFQQAILLEALVPSYDVVPVEFD